MKNRKLPIDSKAFTLVELLVSVAVIAVGMVFVLGAFNQCLSALNTVEKMSIANYLLNKKIWEVDVGVQEIALDPKSGSKETSQEGEVGGVFEPPYDNFNWTLTQAAMPTIFENQTPTFEQSLFMQSLKVAWLQGKHVKGLAETRYIAR